MNKLEKIIAAKQADLILRKQQRPAHALQEKLAGLPPCKGFIATLNTQCTKQHKAIIAEIKKTSPAEGPLGQTLSPMDIAKRYEAHGATCLSVLTEAHFFHGCDEDLKAVRQHSNLPLLRKDFTIDAYQLLEARLLGADAVLLIAAILDDKTLHQLYEAALALGLDVFIESHTSEDLQRAQQCTQALLGINNRNLKTFTVDINTSLQLRHEIPAEQLLVSASGIQSAADINKLQQGGIQVFLVGSALMRAKDPGRALAQLLGS